MKRGDTVRHKNTGSGIRYVVVAILEDRIAVRLKHSRNQSLLYTAKRNLEVVTE